MCPLEEERSGKDSLLRVKNVPGQERHRIRSH
jgi:hypothetical protein